MPRKSSVSRSLGLLLMFILAGLVARAAEAPDPWPAASAIDPFMGDYDGTFTPQGAAAVKAHGRVIALGNHNYQVVLYPMAYPQDDGKQRIELSGTTGGKRLDFIWTLHFAGNANGAAWRGEVQVEKLNATSPLGKFALKHVARRSPTLGARPPLGAVALMPYAADKPTTLEAWKRFGADTPAEWEIRPDAAVQVTHGDIVSKQKFGDSQIHVEFCLPFMPLETGQGRANSGVYVANRYEVQVLDSFGLAAQDNDCGAIYTVSKPLVNAELPPLAWQTYDIIFRAARFDANCDVTELPLLTVYLNGVKVQNGAPVTNPTAGWMPGHTKRGELRLQDHLNPVRYRNVWVLERGDIPYQPNTELAALVQAKGQKAGAPARKSATRKRNRVAQ